MSGEEYDGQDAGYVPESLDFPQNHSIEHDEGNVIDDTGFPQFQPDEHDEADNLEEQANHAENQFDGHGVEDFPGVTDAPLQEYTEGAPPQEYTEGAPPPEYTEGAPPQEYTEGAPPQEYTEGGTPQEYTEGGTPQEYTEGATPQEYTDDVPSKEYSEYAPPQEYTEDVSQHTDLGDVTKNFSSLEKHGVEGEPKEKEIKKWPGWPGENVFRMLVPVQKVGSIIGRKGEFIKKITEETKARIKILDGPPGTMERAVMVSAKEEPDRTIPPAVDGFLRVHKQVVNVDRDPAESASGSGPPVITRLLVAETQAGSLIGKHGSTIKSFQDATGCNIRILGAEHLPVFALRGDSVVEIQGEPAGVHKAVELVASHLRKFLVDRSIIGVFESQMQRPDIRVNQNAPPPQPWGPPPPQGFSTPGSGGGGPVFPPNQYMPPSHNYDNYYSGGPADLPPMDKHHQGPPPPYARDTSVGIHSSGAQSQQSVTAKVTQHMQIPLTYADAVIGASGANISYIRRASGASITVQETRGVPGEMTVEISGTASQIQAAQQLVQNFMAEAANAAQDPMNQSYNPYPNNAPVYASPPSSAAGHTGHVPPSADYGPVYGSNYGY